VEIALMQRSEGKTVQTVYTGNEVDVLVKAIQATMES
jgi:hypothetical protein